MALIKQVGKSFGLCAGMILLGVSSVLALDPSTLKGPQFSQVVMDRQGHLHAVWIQHTGAQSELFYQVLNPLKSSSQESPALLIAQSSSRLRRPQVVIQEGNVHILWQERFEKASGARAVEGTWVHYMRLEAGEVGQSGPIPQVVLNDRPKAMHPNLTVDLHGNALVVWEESLPADPTGTGSLILIKIPSNALRTERYRIPAGDGTAKRAFPAVAADRKGNIHLVWTDPGSGKTDRMVYTILDAKAFQPRGEAKVVHTVPAALGLRKSLSMESSGQIKLTWATKRAEGGFGEVPSDSNYLWITSKIGAASKVVDRHLHDVSETTGPLGDPATLNKRPVLLPPDRTASLELRGETPPKQHLDLAKDVEKRLKRQLLEFASWTGAPPDETVSMPSAFIPSSSLSIHLIQAIQTSYNRPTGLNGPNGPNELNHISQFPNLTNEEG